MKSELLYKTEFGFVFSSLNNPIFSSPPQNVTFLLENADFDMQTAKYLYIFFKGPSCMVNLGTVPTLFLSSEVCGNHLQIIVMMY